MWTCPDCGRRFANTNQWHACQTTTPEDYLATRSEHAVEIYEVVLAALQDSGDFRIHAQRSRIAFISTMTFAGISLAERWADLSLILPKPLDSPRVRRLELYGPSSWGHTVRLTSPDEVDDELRGWLGEALRRGDRETLDPDREVSPLTPRQLGVLWTGFRGRIRDERVELPRHVAEALEMVDEVVVKAAGSEWDSEVVRDGVKAYVALGRHRGLGEGEELDVFLKVDAT